MAKLSKRIVDSAEAGGKDYFIWDDELPGFGLRVFRSGQMQLPRSVSRARSDAPFHDRAAWSLDA